MSHKPLKWLKTEKFGFILTRQEKRALDLLAEIDGDVSQAGIVRRPIRQEAKRLEAWPPPEDAGAEGRDDEDQASE